VLRGVVAGSNRFGVRRRRAAATKSLRPVAPAGKAGGSVAAKSSNSPERANSRVTFSPADQAKANASKLEQSSTRLAIVNARKLPET
jgi:hypothetical protein